MAKHSETIQGTEKEFLDEFQKLCYSRSSWQVWADLMAAMACSISNVADRSPEHYESREKEYAQCIERLGSVEVPAKMLAIIVEALERNPEQDFLGAMYMQLNLGNHWKGQFFTPYCVCKMMSEITCEDVDSHIEKQGYLSICDPACGAGATLIAAANTMKKCKHNFQNHVVFVAQDIDRITGMMCYIQLSLLGCAGYVCIANTITNPLTGHVLFPNEKDGQELWYMSIKNVYAQIVSFDNLLQAEKDARAGKRYENEQLAFWGNLEDNIHSISEKLKCHNYPPDIYHHFYVYEPKLRKVIFSDYTTKVIQRAAYNVLNPIVCKGMIMIKEICRRNT